MYSNECSQLLGSSAYSVQMIL